MDAISKAIELLGGARKAAARLGVSVPAVYLWKSGQRTFPADLCPLVERETGVRCEEIRPDVEWSVLRQNSSPASQEAA